VGRMDGKVALVTGSTRGIGRGIAERFAAEGAAVVITGRSEDDGRAVADGIAAAGGSAAYVRADLSIESDVAGVVAAAVERFGALTTLVNNAAPTELMGPGRSDRSVAEVADDAWDAIMTVALKAVVWACRHAVPHLAVAPGAAILNVSSAASLLGVPGLDTYTAAKGAINALTRSMAVEFAPQDIRVNCVLPGMVLTSPGAFALMDDPVIGSATRAIHLTRLGIPADIAHAAVYLCSDESEFVTGVLLPVDGGVTARMNVPDISAAAIDLG
jgi:meso-butanediol dehydrogenase/(S,S)-butanediol dehydrogenase/diacetyl reductase